MRDQTAFLIGGKDLRYKGQVVATIIKIKVNSAIIKKTYKCKCN